MIWIKILIVLLMAVLNYTRGKHWRPISMLAMTFIMGSYFAILYHTWWLFIVVGGPMYGCLTLPDGNRGVWCSLVALGASIALLLTGHLAWYWFIVYCGGNFLLGWIANKPKIWGKWSNQFTVDMITGAGFGALVFLR